MNQQKNEPQTFLEEISPLSPILIEDSQVSPSNERRNRASRASPEDVSSPLPISNDEDQIQPVEERQSVVSTDNRASQDSSEDNAEPIRDDKAPKGAGYTSRLERSRHALTVFTCYAVLAVFTWTCTCIMVYRPLTTKRYGYGDKDEYGAVHAASPDKYVNNERLYQAIRFLQAIVAVLTIPVTSAICAQGAVIFMQRKKKNAGLSLRQMMVLADKGWTDMGVLSSILHENWERFGSRFLLVAVALHLLGFTISPLQQIFVQDETILVPTNEYLYLYGICDINDHFRDLPIYEGILFDYNLVTVLTRAALASTVNTDPQLRLWQSSTPVCVPNDDSADALYRQYDSSCTQGAASLANMYALLDPFLAQLPSSFNTGLVTQFAPRINSTAILDRDIDESEFPKGCQDMKNSFFVAYNYSEGDPAIQGYMHFDMEACMPDDQTQPKWINTRSRQDFEEVLYLNITTHGTSLSDYGLRRTLYRVRVKTTAGFFELPNYAHTDPGPLLANGPAGSCGNDCTGQLPKRKATVNTTTMFNVESVPNKGPLLTTALALFGEDSFIADRYYNWESYISARILPNVSQNPYHCQEVVPFSGLMATALAQEPDLMQNEVAQCADNKLFHQYDVYKQIFDYLQFFQAKSSDLQGAFTAAAYLANEAWLLHPNGGSTECRMEITMDHGTESRKPHISPAGIITISVLLSVFLLSLLAIALYSYHSPRWTSQLNSFAMIRIGASIADKVPLKFVNNVDNVRLLDHISGTMGGEPSDTDNVDDLKLGGLKRLSRETLYSSIDRVLTLEEKRIVERTPYTHYWGKDGVLRSRAERTDP